MSSDVQHVLIVVFAALAAAGLVFAVASGWRATRVRPLFEAGSMLIGAAALAGIGALVGVQTPVALGAGAAAVGFLLGLVQGRTARIELRGGQVYARRSPEGLAVWGVGLVALQLAGLGSRVELFRIGQAAGFFGVGLMAGVLLGRISATKRARLNLPGAAAIGSLAFAAIVLFQVEGSEAQSAEGALSDPETACAVMPAQLDAVQIEYEPPDQVGACRGLSGGSIVQLVLFSSPEVAEAAWSLGTTLYVLGPADVGDSGQRAGTESGGVEWVDFVRGPFIVTVQVKVNGAPSEAASLELARQTDANILAVLEASEAPADSSSSPGANAAAEEDEAESRPEESADEDGQDEAEAGSEDTERGEGRGEDGVGEPEPEDEPEVAAPVTALDADNGFLGGGFIDSDEAVNAALAAVIAAWFMGMIGFPEASASIAGILGRAGRPQLAEPMVETLLRGVDASGRGAALPAAHGDGTFEPLEGDEPGLPAPAGDADEAIAGEPLQAVSEEPYVEPPGGLQLSEREIGDVVANGRRSGTSAQDLQRYLDGLNESRGGSGAVPLSGLDSVVLPDGKAVTAWTDEIAAYREAQDMLNGTKLLDGFLQDLYKDSVAEKERWVKLQQMPARRWAAAVSQVIEEAGEFDRKIAEAEARIRLIADTAPPEASPSILASIEPSSPLDVGGLAAKVGRDAWEFQYADLRGHATKEFWEMAKNDIPRILEEIDKLKAARLERVQELMGTNVGGEIRTVGDASQASWTHRPSLKLDEIEAHMDHLVEERKRVMAVRNAAQNVVDAFERRASGP